MISGRGLSRGGVRRISRTISMPRAEVGLRHANRGRSRLTRDVRSDRRRAAFFFFCAGLRSVAAARRGLRRAARMARARSALLPARRADPGFTRRSAIAVSVLSAAFSSLRLRARMVAILAVTELLGPRDERARSA